MKLIGEKWKKARDLVSPVFTSGQLKEMVPLMHLLSVRLIKDTSELIKNTRYVNTFQLFTQYSFEVMMATSFGSREKPTTEDLEMTMRYTPNVFAMVLAVVCPALAKISG